MEIQFPNPLVKTENKATQTIFTRHFECEKNCKNWLISVKTDNFNCSL